MYSLNRYKSLLLAGALGMGLLSAACAPIASPAATEPLRNTISVTGNGVAFGTPDVATVQIGVQSRNTDPAAAVDENTAKVGALVETLKGLGIAEEDMQTSNFSVSAQQDYDPATGQPRGTFTYVVDNTLTVTVRDLARLGEALSQAVSAGANTIYGVSFSVEDPAALEAEAREKAMADAKARAEALARAAGVTLGNPISISEYFSSPPVPYAVARDEVASAAPVPIQAGQLQVNLQVNVSYEIR